MMTKSDQALLESLMCEAFERPRDPRSAEYKAGVRALLAARIAEIPVVCPYPQGSPHSDAFYAGKDEGCRIWREHAHPYGQPSSAPLPVRGAPTSATDVMRMVIASADAAQNPPRPSEQRCAIFVAGLAGSLGCHSGTEQVVDVLLSLADINPHPRPTLIG